MDRDQLLQYVAPCALLCYSCPGLKDGAISQCASRLCGYFEGYYDFNDANLPEKYRPWLDEFAAFERRLERFTQSTCPGCRSNPKPGAGCIEGCVVPSCVKEKGIDYCGECNDFPCEKARSFFARINDVIGKDWENGSRRIGEIGIDAYFEERKDRSHYASYKK